MPYDQKSPEPSNDDMFSDGPTPPEPKMAESEEPSEGQTAIVPKSILGGKEFKPGEEVVLKVVAIHDNDVEVKYASEEGSGEEEAPGEEAMAEPPSKGQGQDAEMASMME